jgi:hypothetical protein
MTAAQKMAVMASLTQFADCGCDPDRHRGCGKDEARQEAKGEMDHGDCNNS